MCTAFQRSAEEEKEKDPLDDDRIFLDIQTFETTRGKELLQGREKGKKNRANVVEFRPSFAGVGTCRVSMTSRHVISCSCNEDWTHNGNADYYRLGVWASDFVTSFLLPPDS